VDVGRSEKPQATRSSGEGKMSGLRSGPLRTCIPSSGKTLPGASKGVLTGGKRTITKRLLMKVHTFCLSENPLLAPGNVLPDEGIVATLARLQSRPQRQRVQTPGFRLRLRLLSHLTSSPAFIILTPSWLTVHKVERCKSLMYSTLLICIARITPSKASRNAIQ
jgi:hypothetical protein